MATSVDAVLKEWGEELFYRLPKKGRRSRTITGVFFNAKAYPSVQELRSPRVIKATIRAAARKSPEVMVKISGSGKGMSQVRAHLDYISRNGHLTIEDQNGELIAGKHAVRDLAAEWQYGLFGIPEEGYRRETFNIVLSMPPGTDRDAVRLAASEFGQKVFGIERPYVFVAHDDEKHPHVHLCVKSLGLDGKRLNPRKADLQLWREQFADSLRNHGIDACATPRIARGTRRKTTSQARHHRHSPKAITKPCAGPYSSERSHLANYAKLAKLLAASGGEGSALAIDVTRTVRAMAGMNSFPEPRNEELRKDATQLKDRRRHDRDR